MFKFISKMFKKEINTGAIDDPRSEEEIEQDYQADEIASFAPIAWEEKTEKDWRKFPITNQSRSSSCVGHSVAKLLGIENWLEENKFVHYSARDIYTRRKNFPSKGMWFKNAMSLGKKHGLAFEQLMPSYGMNEEAMNKAEDRTPLTEATAMVGRGGNYIAIPLDIEKIASIIEPKGKPVMIGVRFNKGEWNRTVPKIIHNKGIYHHGICATNAILYKGKRALVIEDSWGSSVPSFSGRRIVTEDWFKAKRISAAWYYEHFSNVYQPHKVPKFVFGKNLSWGMRNNSDVSKLQEVLKAFGHFPNNVTITGNYFSITAKAVLEWQMKYEVASIEELQRLKGRHFGPKSREKMNELLKSN